MKNKQSGSKSIDLYRRFTLLILFGLFAFLPQLEVLIKNEKGEYTSFGRLIEAEFEKKWSLATPAPL